jgi:outer membrane protein assembly factor BamB
VWTFRAGSLVEFPPVVGGGRLYVGTNRGRVAAIEASSGEVVWELETKRCIAASPALGDGVVFVVLMDPSPCAKHDESAPGYLVALDAASGVERWRFEAGVVETSPLLVDGVLFVGAWDGNVYAVDAGTGRKRWSFRTGGQVKSGAAYRDGVVYIGSYDGKLYALDAATGRELWSSGGRSGLFGSGRFYSTPAVAYGRVFIGNVDGRVYAFGARSGDLLWSHTTGGYVYSSPAIANETVYVGSYDGRLYALDAATGDVRWEYRGDGPISGSATVIGDLVYFSTLEGTTFALEARRGERVWSFPDGEYTPVVADGRRVYLTGLGRVYGLEPRAEREAAP